MPITKTCEQLQSSLALIGVNAQLDHIYSSALVTAKYVKMHFPTSKVRMIGSRGIYEALVTEGIENRIAILDPFGVKRLWSVSVPKRPAVLAETTYRIVIRGIVPTGAAKRFVRMSSIRGLRVRVHLKNMLTRRLAVDDTAARVESILI